MVLHLAVIRGTARFNLPELAMYSSLRTEGFAPELICSNRSSITEDEAGLPIRRLRIPWVAGAIAPTLVGGYLIGHVSPYRYYHQYLLGFHRAVRNVDVLCPVDLGHPTSFQSIRERRYGKKVLVQCWDNIPFNWPHDRPLRVHYEAVLDAADHFLALTEDARRTLRAMGVGEERISRLNIGVDLAFWRPPVAARTGQEALELLFVSRLEWPKGLRTLIEALDLVRSRVRLTIVGAGPEEGRLRWLVEQRRRRGNAASTGAVRFVGPRYGTDLLRLRQDADVQLVPSISTPQWREQSSSSLIEGLSCGLPAIVSDVGALPEVVSDHENGLLVPADSPVRLAEAIDYLAQHPDERRRMGEAARRRVERDYDPHRQGRLLAEVIRTKVLAG